jgi:hypothetical protein
MTQLARNAFDVLLKNVTSLIHGKEEAIRLILSC